MDITLRNLFRQPHFVKLWLSQTLQSLATVLLQVIVMVKVYQQTDSVLGSSSVLAVMAFGSFAGGILGSYHIHRFSLVRLLHGIGWTRAGLTIILGLLLSNIHSLFLVFLLINLFLIAAVGAWYQPARFALLPLVVSKKEYMKANGTLNVIHQLFLVAGWGLGGMMAVILPFYTVILITSLSFLLSGVCVRLIRLNHSYKGEKSSKPEPAWRKMMKVGVLRNLTLMDISEALANVVWSSAFILAFTHEILKKGSEWWGFINAAYWVGGIAGSFMVVMMTRLLERRVGLMIGLSALSMALCTFLFAINTNAILALVLCILMGPLYQTREICQETVLQDVIEPQERANVMAARSAILTPWWGMAYLIMGWAADGMDIQSTYILGAVLYGVTFLIVILHPQLKDYQYHVEQKSSISR
ncbi:MFS transporter [Polycladomyces subterraneus]|uniref:MFS transporter n=1 Tax=Polycladomyces subterraneus TaxID=1016997 RepID=A0ABT8IJU3_9BACL|nr:MFS transporter [Polycladomyces subterraneus]MDN4593008.1 MFS transporter [Polycladomyces subterraneus]